jgi:hypothetical protein
MRVPDCAGFCAAVGAVLALFGGAWIAIQTRNLAVFVCSFIVFLALAHIAVFSLNPEDRLNLRRDSEKQRPGPTALAIFSFLNRCGLALAPALVATLAGIGTIGAAFGLVQSIGSNNYEVPQIGSPSGVSGLVLWAGVIPLVAYLGYLLAMLGVELCQAVLTLNTRSVPAASAETQLSEEKGHPIR